MRHIMEPDPDSPPVNPAPALWIVAVVLLVVLVLAHG